MDSLTVSRMLIKAQLTCEAARLGTFGPRRPLGELAVDGALHRAGRVHLPVLLQAQLQGQRQTCLYRRHGVTTRMADRRRAGERGRQECGRQERRGEEREKREAQQNKKVSGGQTPKLLKI